MASHPMTNPDRPQDVTCPRCQARYKVVRMKVEPGKSHPTLQCRACHGPLASTEGDNILKYFLVSRSNSKAQSPSMDAPLSP
jgi:hypothetical protein